EDNPLNLEMLSRRLERKGFTVIHADNGARGVERARTERPDLIVMDMSMPVLNGWEATRQLKSMPETRAIPVIALTAHAMIGDREQALQAGCDDYEIKPVDLPRLLEKMQRLLGHPAGNGSAPDENISIRSPGTETGIEGSGYKLLIVDDNPLNREM